MREYELSEAFKKSFGYDPPEPVVFETVPGRKEISDLGQPYYAEDLFGREFFLPVTLNGILIPFAVLGMTWKKTIINTALPERGGTVKEMISIDDYVFNLKGILINDENIFPEAQIREMLSLFRTNSSIEMRSVLSDIVLSGATGHRVVIRDIKWPTVTGIEHSRPFEMELESDMILDLEIKDYGQVGPQE